MNKTTTQKYSLKTLASLLNAQYIGDPNVTIQGIADLSEATPNELSFFANPKYLRAAQSSNAGIIISKEPIQNREGNYLLHSSPSAAFQQVLDLFLGNLSQKSGFEGVHPTAVIHPSASVHPTAHLGPHVVIDADTTIGAETHIGANSVIGRGCSIGEHCLLHPNVTVREYCSLGNHVILQPGAVIGSCGFGYETTKAGEHKKLKQLGTVRIEDDVEIGANTTIDRARFGETIVEKGTKVDNLVQLAHGVQVGQHCLLASQVGIAGSTKLSHHVTLAGKVGVVGHLKIAAFIQVGAQSGIFKNLTTPGAYRGHPAEPITSWSRRQVYLRRIEKIAKRLEKLEAKIGHDSEG